ncbi:MAG TPA: phosphotransferase family protein [Streptosporangiaceae bacterium]|jgi:aminoglycoside phosphotransferase (APT) family kinase protein|nr:phosphotransferase family protein [Streptosporangiaceae bacterium]
MPVPDQRDPDVTRSRLQGWLERQLRGASHPEVTAVQTPANTGFSSETLMFDATWTEADGTARRERLVAKVAPTGFQIFPDPRFDEQFRLLQILAGTAIPVPKVHWSEADPAVLGAPFYVMSRVDGEVPTDMPPYHTGGWLTTTSPAERESIWWSGLSVLAQVHSLDVARLGLEFVDQVSYGPTGLRQRLAYYEHYLEWAYEGSVPVVREALRWLHENRPEEPRDPVLLWGDSRIGNIIFTAGRAAAVLDWEMATLGQPEEDLAWFLLLDRHHSEGVGFPRLPGFPDAAQTISRYEQMTGRKLANMDYYEVLSAMKFAVVMARIGQLFIHYDLVPADNDFPYNNTASQLLAKILGLPPPGGEMFVPDLNAPESS